MFTLGYSFKPWEAAKAIADGPTSSSYVRETAREYGVDERDPLRPPGGRAPSGRATRRAGPSRPSAPTPARRCTITCDFLFCASGYYRYDEGYTPEFEGTERFARPDRPPPALARGPRLRRQARRGDRQRRDRRDAGARRWPSEAEHVTMLQRSPSYVVSAARRRTRSPTSCARSCPPKAAYAIVRWKNVAAHDRLIYRLSRRAPKLRARTLIRKGVAAQLPDGLRRRHPLQPALRPVGPAPVPRARRRPVRGASRAGDASVVTDRIETFTEKGIRLESGDELEADIIVTATGLNLQAARRRWTLTVDGRERRAVRDGRATRG